MATDQTITGTFVNPMGEPLENGYLVLQLSHDSQSGTPNQVVSGFRLRVTLDSSGQISPPVAIYSNTGLLPDDSFYYATVYAADGTEAVPRSTITIPNTPTPVDLSTLTWGAAPG
jgi:hypothetical protein